MTTFTPDHELVTTLTRYDQVAAALADARLQVPPVPSAGPAVDLRWLRATASRFSTGGRHLRRRGLAEDLLAGCAPAQLRARAAALTGSLPDQWVPVAVLAAALGAPESVVPDVFTVAGRYLPGSRAPDADTAADGDADAAVAALVDVFGGHPDEGTAARIALLVQASSATGALIGNTLRALARWRLDAPVPALLTEVLRYDPPVRLLRRQYVAVVGDLPAGTPVVLDLAAANRDPDVFPDPDSFAPGRLRLPLTFGVGLRPCPGRDHAFALATGVVEAVLAGRDG
jgi:cytochrome P450